MHGSLTCQGLKPLKNATPKKWKKEIMSIRDNHIERLLSVLEANNSILESNQRIIGQLINLLGTEDFSDSNTSEWISTKEAAILVGVSSQTVRDWVRAGEVKGKRVGEKKIAVYKPSALARAKYITD